MRVKRTALRRLCLPAYFALTLWTWLIEWKGLFIVWVFFGPPAFVVQALLLTTPSGWPIPVWGFVTVVAIQAGALILVRRWHAREGRHGKVAQWLRVPLLATMALMAIGCAVDLMF
ncbi:hypothetical protein [Nonomuraea sp. NPDC049158]|uniref:hypothetical protein n=1 Tax=Nonomuraea sp. NPDC049158 TaxID=3155649 RepID=UPI0033C16B91